MLKTLISKKDYDNLPDAIKEHYKVQSGTDDYVLDQDDSSYKDKLSEFRNNNIKLAQEQETLRKEMEKFEGVDPAKYSEYQERLQQLEDKKLLEEGDVEKLIESRTDRMRSDYEGRIAKLEENNQALSGEKGLIEGKLATVVIDSEVQQGVSSIGAVRQNAMKDVLARARTVFQLREGEVTPIGADGNVLYGADGKNPLTISEWCSGLAEEAPFLFEGSQGSGAAGDGGSGGTGDNKTILANDSEAISSNLEQIAKGEVKVAVPSS